MTEQDTKDFSADKLCDQIGRFIVACRLPFNVVSHIQFKRMIQQAGRSFSVTIPSRQKVRDRILELSHLGYQEVLSIIPTDSKVSLALDCWTSPQRRSFLAVTGYYITPDFEYKDVLLGFDHISGAHTGIRLADTTLDVLQNASLQHRVLAVTTDNASNNSTLMDNLSSRIKESILNSRDSGPRYTDSSVRRLLSSPPRIPCLAHVIQLSVQSLLQSIEADASNHDTDIIWEESIDNHLAARQGLPSTLEKVRLLLLL
jgi:hypothetical protein